MNLYISKTGNDANNGCSETGAFYTINRAITGVHSYFDGSSTITQTGLFGGDTVYIGTGTWVEGISGISDLYGTNIGIRGGDADDNRLSFIGTYNQTILQPNQAWIQAVVHLQGTGHNYITFDSLILDADNLGTSFPGVFNAGAYISITDHDLAYTYVNGMPEYIEFKNCTMRFATYGVLSAGSNCRYYNCDVYGNGMKVFDCNNSRLLHGFYLSMYGNTVENCRAHGNAGQGIHFYSCGSGLARPSGNIIRNNMVWNNAGRGIGLYSNAINNQIYNNVIWNNGCGLYLAYGGINNEVYFNTLYQNWNCLKYATYIDSIFIDSTFTGTVVKNNIMWNCKWGLADNGVGTIKSNNLNGNWLLSSTNQDPLFNNTIQNDYRLQKNSPAINSGVAIAGIETDIRGVTRRDPPDLGAYECMAY
jgi:parallel beta-helix repeat protein